MVKRLLPLLVALAVAGAPVAMEAMEACQVACMSSMARSAMPHPAMSSASEGAAHACHDGAADYRPQLSHVSHACQHNGDDQLPAPGVVAAQSASVAAPVAFVGVSTVAILAPAPTLTLRLARASHPVLPTGGRSTIPLRI
jgi:hypothetical protein